MANTFDAGSDPFDFADGDWELTEQTPAERQDAAVMQDGEGEYVEDSEKTYNVRQECSATYVAKNPGSITGKAVSLGLASAAGYAPTEVRLETGHNHARATITGHKHDSSAHSANQQDVTLPTITGWGASDFLGNPANDGCQSSSWSATIGHVDKLKKDGTFLCGRSQGCRIEASGQYVADAAPTLASGWTQDDEDTKKGGDFYTSSLRAHKYQGV